MENSNDPSSPLSTHTGASVEDIERKIAEMLIDEKRKELGPDAKIPFSIPEEDETEKTASIEEDEKKLKKKGSKCKNGGGPDLAKLKQNLKDFVEEDSRQTGYKTNYTNVIKSPLIPQGISQIQSGLGSNIPSNNPTPKLGPSTYRGDQIR